MFPLHDDIAYINKDGSRTTLGDRTGDIAGIIEEIDNLEGDLDNVADSVTPISQTGTKATAAITAGTYFYLDGALVEALTNIAIDDTFTENTNYKTIDGGLNDLKGMADELDGRLDIVEGSITTLNTPSRGTLTDMPEDSVFNYTLWKMGKLVCFSCQGGSFSITGSATICKIPTGFFNTSNSFTLVGMMNTGSWTAARFSVDTSGNIKCLSTSQAFTAFNATGCWYLD